MARGKEMSLADVDVKQQSIRSILFLVVCKHKLKNKNTTLSEQFQIPIEKS